MNIYQALDEFCSYHAFIKGHSPETIKRIRQCNTRFVRRTGVRQFEDITIEKVNRFFLESRTKYRWMPTTFQTNHQTIHSFMKWAKTQGYIKENYLDDIEKPKWKRRLPIRLTKDQAFAWLKYVRNYPYSYRAEFYSARNHAIYATFLYTGIRRCELTKLELRDIDLVNLELKVRDGKGGKDRLIPLCFAHAQIVKTYLNIRKKMRFTTPYLFTTLKVRQQLSVASLVHIHNTLRKDAPVSCTIHQLRHTFATLMIEGGCDLPSLSAMMGHAHISTTMHYIKASTHHLKSQITKHPLNTM